MFSSVFRTSTFSTSLPHTHKKKSTSYSEMTAPTYLLDIRRQQLLASSEYTASSTFSASHEWVADGSADILATTAAANSTDPAATPQHAKITIVGRVLGGPRFLKLKDVGNYNDRFMTMSASKWVIHLGKPTGTVYEEDWALALSNVRAFEERVATSRGINMLVYAPNDVPKDLRATAPCFLPNDIEGDDKALLAYKSKLGPRFRDEYSDLSPWWKLNELKIVNAKGFGVPAGVPQEKSMEKSLVLLTFSITHNYISSTKVDSFSAIIDKVRVLIPGMHYNNHVQENANAPTPAGVAPANILQAPPVPTVTTVTIATSPSTSTAATNVGNNTNNNVNTAVLTSDITSTLPGTETSVSEAGDAHGRNRTGEAADVENDGAMKKTAAGSSAALKGTVVARDGKNEEDAGVMNESAAGSSSAPKDTAKIGGDYAMEKNSDFEESLQQDGDVVPENAKQPNQGKKPVKSSKRKAESTGETSVKKSRA